MLNEMSSADSFGQQKQALAMKPEAMSLQPTLYMSDLPSPTRAKSSRSTSAGSISCAFSGTSLGECSNDDGSRLDNDMHEDIPLDSDESDEEEGHGDRDGLRGAAMGRGIALPSRALEPASVAPFLARFGFMAQDANTWHAEYPLPRFHLRVMAHEEVHGHTQYMLICEVRAPALAGVSEQSWGTKKRLQELRAHLHDVVKRELGAQEYRRHFAAAPFARRGGLRGTSSRLNTWLRALMSYVAEGSLRPQLMAEILMMLDAPQTSESSPVVRFH